MKSVKKESRMMASTSVDAEGGAGQGGGYISAGVWKDLSCRGKI